MADSMLTGSICLTDIPKELIKEVKCKDGQLRKYLNVAIITKKKPHHIYEQWPASHLYPFHQLRTQKGRAQRWRKLHSRRP